MVGKLSLFFWFDKVCDIMIYKYFVGKWLGTVFWISLCDKELLFFFVLFLLFYYVLRQSQCDFLFGK